MSEYITTYTGLYCPCSVADLQGKWACADILVCGRALYLLCKRGSSERIFRAYDTCMSAP